MDYVKNSPSNKMISIPSCTREFANPQSQVYSGNYKNDQRAAPRDIRNKIED